MQGTFSCTLLTCTVNMEKQVNFLDVFYIGHQGRLILIQKGIIWRAGYESPLLGAWTDA